MENIKQTSCKNGGIFGFENPFKKLKESNEEKKNASRYKSHGVAEEVATSNFPFEDGVISKYSVQLEMDSYASSQIKDYCSQLAAGAFKDSYTYFNKKQGRIYDLVKAFYNSEFGTPDAECNIMDLTRILAARRRQVLGKEFADEKLMAPIAKKSYETGTVVKNEDTLRTMAWACTHAYCTGLFFDSKGIFDMIPKLEESIFPIWNSFIQSQDDIPDFVKGMFFINGATCPYVQAHKDEFCALAVIDHPTDDISFTDTSADIGHISLNQQYKDAVNRDTDHSHKRTRERVFNAEKSTAEKYTFGSLATKDPTTAVNPANIAKAMPVATIDINPKDVKEEPVKEEVTLSLSVEDWEKMIPRLDKLTNLIRSIKFDVKYSQSKEFPGLIEANIIDPKTTGAMNQILIDPCIIYGDTLRVVAHKEGQDIRHEAFVPISQKSSIVAIIKDRFNRSDERAMMKALPDFMKDTKSEYHFLDRVDLRGLGNEERTGLPFEDWTAMIKNINYILNKDEETMGCRFRIVGYENPRKFNLVCDDKVLCAFESKILKDPNLKNMLIEVIPDPETKNRIMYRITK